MQRLFCGKGVDGAGCSEETGELVKWTRRLSGGRDTTSAMVGGSQVLVTTSWGCLVGARYRDFAQSIVIDGDGADSETCAVGLHFACLRRRGRRGAEDLLSVVRLQPFDGGLDG